MGPVLSANQNVAQERSVRGYIIATEEHALPYSL